MRLEVRLLKSFKKLQQIVQGNGSYSTQQFYQEYHHYERLNTRYKKETGSSFNPARYAEQKECVL